MNNFPTRQQIEGTRKRYPEGTRVKCIRMSGETSVKSGDLGTVKFVDDAGQIHVNWDNGSTLGVVFGEEECRRIEDNG